MNPSPDCSPKNILSLLEVQSIHFGSAAAIQAPDGPTISYAELFRRVTAMTAELRKQGITPASRVAIVLPNGLDMAIALLGVSCAAIAVPLNPAYKEPEYEAYLGETKASHLLVTNGAYSPARLAAKKLGLQVLELAAVGDLANASSAADAPLELPDPDSVAMILLTSGSTGRPKRVPLTHRNLCTSACHVRDSLSLSPEDRCLSMWEQHHIGGLVDLLLAPLSSGGKIICAGSFDAARCYELLAEHAPTWFQGVPTTLRELLVYGKSKFTSLPPHSLRFLRSVAAALPPSLMEEIEHYFGVPVIQTFGMTEASPLITTNLLPPALRKPGSAGKTCGPEVAIMDEHGCPLGAGAYGEVAVRGDNIFSGYEDNHEANAAAFRNGWFYTGDTGYLDEDGYLFLRGRVKEMINRGGEKISPYEIEDVLSRHPGISQVAAFSVPHPTLGEDVGVAIVARKGSMLPEAAIREFAAERLSAFKVPRTILFIEALPRCPVGKVRRQDLADLAARARASEGFVAPRNALETFLAKLWAAELDLPQVGIDDDFSALGGDSLSSVRLLAAIDKLLGLNFPDDVLAKLTTVRKLAQHIEKMGYVLPSLEKSSATQLDLEIKAALAAVGAAEELAPGQLEDVRKRLEQSRNLREFKTLREAVLHRITPAELAILLGRELCFSLIDLLARIPRGPKSWRVPFELNTWIKQVRQEIAQYPDSLRWSRQRLTDNIELFAASPSSRSDKTLIVGFTGNLTRLMMPIYRFLMHLDADCYDLLLLRDPNRSHYVHGIPEVSKDMATLSDWLRTQAKDMGYSRVIALGTSAGGLASLCAGVANGWDKAIALGADAPSKHPALQDFLSSSASRHDRTSPTQVMLLYAGLNPRDNSGAAEIAAILPNAKLLGDDTHATHNVLNTAFKRGRLNKVLNMILG